jgi:acyl carrier protein
MSDSSGTLEFPEADVRAAIEECWRMETSKGEVAAPTKDKPASIMQPLVEIDSHGVVRCFVAIEKVTGIDIPETEAKDTGYDSLDDLMANLVPLVKKHFEKQKTKLKAKRVTTHADSGA